MIQKSLFWTVFAIITLLAFIPSYEPLPEVVSISDKLNHFAAFAALYALHAYAYPAVGIRQRFLLLLAYGIGIEAIQSLLPTRSASVEDIAVDATALLATMALHTLFARLRPAASSS